MSVLRAIQSNGIRPGSVALKPASQATTLPRATSHAQTRNFAYVSAKYLVKSGCPPEKVAISKAAQRWARPLALAISAAARCLLPCLRPQSRSRLRSCKGYLPTPATRETVMLRRMLSSWMLTVA